MYVRTYITAHYTTLPKNNRSEAKELAKAETKRTLKSASRVQFRRHDTELAARRLQFQTVFNLLFGKHRRDSGFQELQRLNLRPLHDSDSL